MQRIGIHVPYTWDESTQMACTIADLAMRLGVQVSILATQSYDQGIHYRWDKEVISPKRQALVPWASSCSHVIWFDVQSKNLEKIKQLGCHNTLVLMWHRLAQDDHKQFVHFDRVVVPNREAYRLFAGVKEVTRPEIGNYTYVPWTSSISTVTEAMLTGGSSVYLPVEGATIRHIGPTLLHTLRVLMDGDPKIRATISHTKNWSAPALEGLKQLVNRHGERVSVLRKPSHSQRIEAYATHDWVFSPNVYDNSGIVPLEALSSGKPVIAFDSPPVSEFLKHGKNAYLVACDLQNNWANVPRIEPNTSALLDALRTCLTDRQMFQQLSQADNSWLDQRQREFEECWRHIWFEER